MKLRMNITEDTDGVLKMDTRDKSIVSEKESYDGYKTLSFMLMGGMIPLILDRFPSLGLYIGIAYASAVVLWMIKKIKWN
jgi:hypothetical protein